MTRKMKKKVFTTQVKVEYSHTDKMEYVHHSQYLVYYEFARWEFFRKLNMSYKSIESSGIIMPVVSVNVKYCKPAFYDDLLTIKSKVRLVGARFVFSHIIYNQKNEIINKAQIEVLCVNNSNRKPIKPHMQITANLNHYLKTEKNYAKT